MGFKEKMMNKRMGKMSAEERKEMMESFFSRMSGEEKEAMMKGMMDKFCSGMMSEGKPGWIGMKCTG